MAQLSSPTLNRLLRETRIFLNQPNADNSFWTDPELTNYINDAIKQYFLIIEASAEGQFDKKTTIDLVSGQDTYALPSDCFEIRTLHKVCSGYNQILRYDNDLSDSYFTSEINTPNTYQPNYHFLDDSIVLRPGPSFNEAGGLVLVYTAFPETLIVGGDVMTSSISPIFKELVVKYACYQAKLKESSVQGGNTYEAIERHLSGLVDQFRSSVANRSKYPQSIKPFDVY